MALNQKITATEKDFSFLIYDATGRYSNDNPGGYGGPNYTVAQAIKCTLYVQTPNDTAAYPNIIDLTGFYPNTDETAFEIYGSQIGVATNSTLPSGKYKFKTETVFEKDGVQKTVTGYSVQVFTRSIECCIDGLTPTMDKNSFTTQAGMKKIELSALLNAVECQIKNGLYDEASSNIEYLTAQCDCPGC